MLREFNGAKLNVEICGEGVPVVILHGFRLDHEVMVGAFEPIFGERSGYQRIYPDLPGMGRTPGTTALCSSDAIVELLCGMIDDLIPDQPFLLAGFSYGGYLARGILKRKQAQVQGLLLMAPVVYPTERDAPEPHVILRDPDAVSLLPDALAPIVLGNVTVQTRPILERVMGEFSASLPRGDRGFLAQLSDRSKYLFSEDVDALETPFDRPALLITGKQDSNVGYGGAFQLSRLYPRATYVTLDRAGHGVYMEQDRLFTLLVNEWLDRVLEAQAIAV